jgi:hypothetical protein
VAVVSSALALIGAGMGWMVYRAGPEADVRMESASGPVWRAATAAWGVDALAMRLAAWFEQSAGVLSRTVDTGIVDGAVRGVAWAARRAGRELNELQSGEGQLYAALVGAGAVLLASLALWLGR